MNTIFSNLFAEIRKSQSQTEQQSIADVRERVRQSVLCAHSDGKKIVIVNIYIPPIVRQELMAEPGVLVEDCSFGLYHQWKITW